MTLSAILPRLSLAGYPDDIVSKQDSQFFNVFSVVLGILVAVALVLMALSRNVGSSTQVTEVRSDPRYLAEVGERIRPFARVAVAGQDNTALTIESPTGSANAGASVVATPTDGPSLYEVACSTCHAQGIGGAPKSGDKAAWGPRLAQGSTTLYKHAIEGYQGQAGVMPPKGGRVDVSDDLVKAAVDHMIEINQ
jgi:cytochrome c5